MNKNMTQVFISDLHLEAERPDITAIFLSLLTSLNPSNTELFILGDFFEIWVGDDNATEFNRSIIAALNKATRQGLPIYFIHGNRDFLLGKNFFSETGCVLLPDEHVIQINNTPTLLMHGDTLCTEDKAYLKFRKKSRNWLVKKIFLWKSLQKRQALAQRYRDASKAYTSTTPLDIMDVSQAEVERVMVKHGVHHLIHGHTHREAIHTFELNGQPATRTVLGAWHEHGSALIVDENGNQKLIPLGSYPRQEG